MHDKYKKRNKVSRVDLRLRRQIAREAAKRMIAAQLNPFDDAPPPDPTDLLWLDAATENDFHAAKRKAVAVLGHRVRPTDLPTDSEVRDEVRSIVQSGEVPTDLEDESLDPESSEDLGRLADHLDRFTLYKMRLVPLESVKQDARTHPEGDALYHSLQVFEHAKATRPYDEEFLIAALLHDIGKAIDPRNHVGSGVDALRGSVTDRTLWLVEHHMDLCPNPKFRRAVETTVEGWREDLEALREIDEAGRVPGFPVGTIDEALDYLRSLEIEHQDDDMEVAEKPRPIAEN